MHTSQSDSLEELIQNYQVSFKLTPSPYWSAEIYGFGRYIRRYGYFPSWLPLCVETDHGAGPVYTVAKELGSSAPVQLFHSPISVSLWKRHSKKSCYCFYSPFVFCRKTNGIEKTADAKGTIAFPAHTTIHLEDVSNVEVYINQLRELPEKFQPVGICLHMTDVNKGLHKKFLAAGFEVFTAGNIYDDAFSERFYSIIKNFKYSTSNLLGSYTYYCVEMGIPFFIYGQEPEYINKDDLAVPLGKFDPYQQFDSHRNAHDLFFTVTTEITEEQRTFVNTNLGVYDGLGRLQMAAVLYYSLIRRFLMWITFVYAVKRFKKLISGLVSKLHSIFKFFSSLIKGATEGRVKRDF